MLSSEVIDRSRSEIDRLTKSFLDRVARRRSLFVAFPIKPDQSSLNSYVEEIAARATDRGLDKAFAKELYRDIAAFCGQVSGEIDSPSFISEIDISIADILVERIRWSIILTRDKWEKDNPIRDSEREKIVIGKAVAEAETFGIDPEFINKLFRKIIDNSCDVQGREWTVMSQPHKPRLLSGVRPTGKLHLGHYTGAVRNWLDVQDEFDCYYLIADYQALADHANDVESIRQSVRDVALGWLSLGLDPEKGSFVVQSYIPEHAELTMLLSMIAPWSDIKKNPTIKSELKKLARRKQTATVGFVTYPMSQVADVLLPKADLVPAGKDQGPHINFTRSVARIFNRVYSDIFPIPIFKEGAGGTLRGIDREKMGKSAENAIYLSDDPETLRRKVMSIVTDERRVHGNEPGRPSKNPAFDMLDAFDPDKELVKGMRRRYRKGTILDTEIKRHLIEVLEDFLEPIRERQHYFEDRPRLIRDALESGTERERKIAQETMIEVRDSMRIIKYGE